MAAKKWWENNFCEKCQNTVWAKNFVKTALSLNVSEKNVFLRFTQNFKMAAKREGKSIFDKKPHHSGYTLGVKNLVEIAVSSTIFFSNNFFPCPNMFRMSAKVVLCNSVILDM